MDTRAGTRSEDGGRVGSWLLERELGRGGFGAVHLAHHVVHGTPAAVKLILGATEPDEALRVEREAQALARIQHPGIVRLLDHGRHGRGWFLVMELVEGVSLDELVRRGGALPPPEAARVIEALARACEHVHAAGLVHRDIKPQNVIVAPDGQPRLIDFGLVRSLDPAAPSLTATGVLVGTPAYMSPEQVTAQRVDARADVYGLGGALFYALTGESPFRGTNPVTVLTAVLHQRPDKPSAFVSSVPPALDHAVLRCLEKDPALRYDSALALAKALASARRPARKPARRGGGRSLAIGAGAGVLALGGLAVALLASREPITPTTTPTTTEVARTTTPTTTPPPSPATEAPPATVTERASPWRERGLAALKLNDFEAALLAFDRALDDDPRDVVALRRRGGVKLALGDHRGALADLDHAVELGPDDVWTFVHQGLARQNLRDPAGARRAYDRALELDPRSSLALTNRALVLEDLGDETAALADLSRAIEVAPDSPAAYSNRANLYLRRGDAKAAHADLAKAITLAPTMIEGIFNRGMVRAQLEHDLEGAIRDWTRVLELQPDYFAALDSRAKARLQSGDLDGAEADLARALQLQPRHVESRVNLAMLRAQRGDVPAALAELDRALALDPRSARAWSIRGFLRAQQNDAGALEDLERALSLVAPGDPSRTLIEKTLADARARLGR